MKLSEHFKLSEFACHCGKCGEPEMDPRLILSLERLRTLAGDRAITINSGYRCPAHNKSERGKPNSQHLKGTAADIVVAGVSPDRVAELAELVPDFANGGIGRYRTFTHVDVRKGKSRWDFR